VTSIGSDGDLCAVLARAGLPADNLLARRAALPARPYGTCIRGC
jgi:hypothetical protein